MKYVAWVVAALSLYLGLGFLLNVLGLEHDSKYSDGATAVFALVFLGVGLGAIYLSLRRRPKLGAALAIAPFAIIVVAVFVALTTSRWQ